MYSLAYRWCTAELLDQNETSLKFSVHNSKVEIEISFAPLTVTTKQIDHLMHRMTFHSESQVEFDIDERLQDSLFGEHPSYWLHDKDYLKISIETPDTIV